MEAKDTLLTADEMSDISRQQQCLGSIRDRRPYITLLLLAQAEKSFLAGKEAGGEEDWRRQQE